MFSGNALKCDFLEEPCYNLVYLELAACRLTGLPKGMARLLPNLRVLNLNYNFLEDIRGLEGLTRLQKLTIIGSRLKNSKPLIRLLEHMPDMEMLDFRLVLLLWRNWFRAEADIGMQDESVHAWMVFAAACEGCAGCAAAVGAGGQGEDARMGGAGQ